MSRLDPIFATPCHPEVIEDICSLEEDIASMERDIRDIERELPKLEIEKLTKQRDVAIYKLRIVELRKKLEAR
jgi:hypothetical protein